MEGISVRTNLDPVLYESAEPPLVSLYLPTQGTADTDENRIQFDDLVSDARAELARSYKERNITGIERALTELREHLNDVVAPIEQGSLAALISNDHAYLYILGYAVEPRAVVSDAFFIKPLMKHFAFGTHYYLLGLNTDRFSFVHGDFSTLERVGLPHIKDEFSELYPIVYDDHEAALDYTSLENHMPPYHGYKSRNDVKKEEAEKFFRYVDKAIRAYMETALELPVILVSVPEHQEMFRKLSTIPTLLDEGIEKNINGIEAPELLNLATGIIKHERERRTETLLEEFSTAQAHGTGSSDVEELGSALAQRKVRVLFVEEERDIPGTFDSTIGAVRYNSREEQGGHGSIEGADVADAFVRAALAQDADVVVLAPDRMPGTTGIAALYRY